LSVGVITPGGCSRLTGSTVHSGTELGTSSTSTGVHGVPVRTAVSQYPHQTRRMVCNALKDAIVIMWYAETRKKLDGDM